MSSLDDKPVTLLNPGQYLVFAEKDNPTMVPWIYTVDVATAHHFEHGARGTRWVYLGDSAPVRLKKK